MRNLLLWLLLPWPLLAQTATERNADYSEAGSGTSVTLSTGGGHTAAINAVGDLLVFGAWCFQTCTPGTLTMGGQTATRTSVGTPGTTVGTDGNHTGQFYIYYILSSTQSGNQTITFNATGASGQLQVSYIDFGISAGFHMVHHVDSSAGTGANNGVANAPSISGVTGDVLFGVVATGQHVNPSVNSPWSCATFSGSGETQTCQMNTTQNGQAYILSAASGTTSMNWTLINSSIAWESVISSFSFVSNTPNACPTAAQVLKPGTQNTLVTLASLGVTTCFFVSSATGTDTNTGADEQHPWKFAPGMHNCASNCALTANLPTAGRGYILRGGDTWNFGNSGAAAYVGVTPSGNGNNCDAGNSCGWSIGGPSSAWIGTVANPMYFGVDQNWFAGASWVRPIFTGDNATNTSPTPCSFDESSFSFVQSWTGSVNYILDDIEFTGRCWSGFNSGGVYVSIKNHFDNATSNRVIQNNYFHGWTHPSFSTCTGASGNCEAGFGALDGPSSTIQGIGDRISHNVFDGTDTDQQSFSASLFGGYVIEYNVVTHMAQGFITNNTHAYHDNLLDTIFGLSDGFAHGNLSEFNTEFNLNNVFYNNVYKNPFPGGSGCGNVVVWRAPVTHDYAFNNLIYGQPASCSNSNFWDLITSGQGGSDGYTDDEFNNTWILGANGPFSNNTMNTTPTINVMNLHCVSPNGGSGGANCITNAAPTNYQTVAMQTTAAATSQGYTAAETFAYSPTLGSNATVGTGTNKQSICTTLLGSSDAELQRAGTACQSDTTYACAYTVSTHSVSCPARTVAARPISTAWDVGAYQFQGGSSPTVTLLPATVAFGNILLGITTPPTSAVTLTNTGSQTVTITSIALSGDTTDFSQSNNCGASLGAGLNCTITVTFTPHTLFAGAATLSVSDNATGSPQTVALSGTGIGNVTGAGAVSGIGTIKVGP